jgi:dTDP-4-amino-4,6-dideoxygalactose transaminase
MRLRLHGSLPIIIEHTASRAEMHIIGSIFGLADTQPSKSGKPPFLNERDVIRMINARSALWLLATKLKPKTVWIPSYTCDAVISAFEKAHAPVRFFPVDQRLRCCDSDWIDHISRRDFVLRNHYFGSWNEDPSYTSVVRAGAIVIDDAAQALLTPAKDSVAVFTVNSPRKFMGVPDGAYLMGEPQSMAVIHESLSLEPPPPQWFQLSLSANRERSTFDRKGGSSEWFEKSRQVEAEMPIGRYSMSEFSQKHIETMTDFEEIAAKRRENYLSLLAKLAPYALMPFLDEHVVPIGFPVRVPERDAVIKKLFASNIFPPVHWNLRDVVPATFTESHLLSREEMTLPCDQRYGEVEMERMAELVRSEAHR